MTRSFLAGLFVTLLVIVAPWSPAQDSTPVIKAVRRGPQRRDDFNGAKQILIRDRKSLLDGFLGIPSSSTAMCRRQREC